MTRLRVIATVLAVGAASLVAVAPSAAADTTTRLGATTVTTARGVADTLVAAGVTPSGVAPDTGVRLRTGDRGLRGAFTFPITSSTADLTNLTGDILHSGGIVLTSSSATLEVGKFDIDLAAGKVYATEVDGAAAHLAVLDLNLGNLAVSTNGRDGTVLRGIGVSLDPEAAAAINATFGLELPTQAPLLYFGRARVVIS